MWRWNQDGSTISSTVFLGFLCLPFCLLSNLSSSSCWALSSFCFLFSSSTEILLFCLALLSSQSLSHTNVPSPFWTAWQGKSFFLLWQGHRTEIFLVHLSEEGQGPGWQIDVQRWPHTANFFGHWFLQDLSSLRICSLSDVRSLQFAKTVINLQWHFSWTISLQLGQSPLWHEKGQGWVHPLGRGLRQGSLQTWQLVPASCSFFALKTVWHSIWQVWFPQANWRPQGRAHENAFALWQGSGLISCWPKQLISTGIMQGGHGSATNLAVFDLEFEREANPFIEVFNSSDGSGWLSWQLAGQLCPQGRAKLQLWRHGGHGP